MTLVIRSRRTSTPTIRLVTIMITIMTKIVIELFVCLVEDTDDQNDNDYVHL